MRPIEQRSLPELEGIITTTDSNNEKIDALNELGNKLSFADPQRSLALSIEAAAVADASGLPHEKAQALLISAKAVRKLGNITKALEYYQTALKLFESFNDEQGIGECLCGIGVVYHSLGDHKKALEFHKSSLDLAMKVGDFTTGATNIGNIGNVHFAQKNYGKAVEYYNKARSTYEVDGDMEGSARMIGNIGGVRVIQGDLEEGRNHLQHALKINEQMGNNHGIATMLINLGEVYFRLGDTEQSLECLQQALDKSQRLHTRVLEYEAHRTMAMVYESLKNCSLAYMHFKKYHELEKDVNSSEAQKLAANLELQRELDLKDQEAALEKEKRTIVEQKNQIISQEKKRSEDLLLNILPYEVAQELMEKGHSEAKLIDDATVLFTDFKDFTLFGEQLSPQELVAELDICFREFDRIMSKHGIEKIKTVGDCYMAAGGLPVANKTHVGDVIGAALDIQKFVKELQIERAKEGKEGFEVRIGIHTGPVVAGIVGSKKFAYDIWGDTVNTASRMESAGVVGEINISGETYAKCKDRFACEYRGKVAAKNKGEVDMYLVKARA